jgi:hypothetical protein
VLIQSSSIFIDPAQQTQERADGGWILQLGEGTPGVDRRPDQGAFFQSFVQLLIRDHAEQVR